jgi:mRNA biogenesis factor
VDVLFIIEFILELEEDIQKLESADELTSADRSRLSSLKSELENINKRKEKYVEEHPEHRKLVYRPRRQHDEEKKEEVIPQKRNLFNKHGLPRHPERSIYYDPVMNPFGVPPPGMPYMERREFLMHKLVYSRKRDIF